MAKPDICYLCTRQLTPPVNQDQVPGQQFFPPALRKEHGPLQLLTIPVHTSCNSAYKADEDYFVHSLMPFARGTVAGDAVYSHVLSAYRAGHNAGLVKKVLGEFDRRPSGLVLPGNKVVKRFDGDRIQRVAWKIVRGLMFHHFGTAYPEKQNTWVTATPVGEPRPEHFDVFMQTQTEDAHGRYQGAFSYRFGKYEVEAEGAVQFLHYWALLLWDRVLLTVIFHDHLCACEGCEAARQDCAVEA
jgi:hypothetical protein